MPLVKQNSVRDVDHAERPTQVFRSRRHRNPVYLLDCYLEWCNSRTVAAYQQLVAALDDCDEETRTVAETLLHRCSPRRRPRSTPVPVKFGEGGQKQ